MALAAERYRKAQGRWPASLNDLVPDYIVKVPLDPFNGEPLKLGKHPQGIVVYSVGVDAIDNGGAVDIHRQLQPGFDLGFRLWDVKYRRQPAKPLPKPDDLPPD